MQESYRLVEAFVQPKMVVSNIINQMLYYKNEVKFKILEIKDPAPAVAEEVVEEPLIKTEKTGTVTLIGVNRADVRNCINSAASTELSAAIDAFENDPESPVAVLYGVGGNFCAGYDLKELTDNTDSIANVLLRSEGAMVSEIN